MNVLSPSEKGNLMQNTSVVGRKVAPKEGLVHETCGYASSHGRRDLRWDQVGCFEVGR